MGLAVLKTKSGLLKLAHVALGGIVFGIFVGIELFVQSDTLAFTYPHTTMEMYDQNHFLARLFREMFIISGGMFYVFIVTFAYFLTSFLLLISSFFEDTEERNRSLFEILYHVLGFFFQLAAGFALLVPLVQGKKHVRNHTDIDNLYITSTIFIFVNSVAYAANAIIACRLRKK